MGTKPPFERMLDALAHPYRRQLLVALTEHDPQAAQGGLDADHALASAHGGIDSENIPQGALVREHLPKLKRYGYIAQDETTREISKGPNWDEIEPLLRILQENEAELPPDWLDIPDDVLVDQSEDLTATPELLWALAQARNRHVLRFFIETDTNEVPVTTLAEYVAEQSTTPHRNDPQRTEMRLHHTSLPQLDELSILTYDAEAGVVRKAREPIVPPDLKNDVLTLDQHDRSTAK